ncbi:12522_t:CDS:1, partial [Acaulospora morrowiae]
AMAQMHSFLIENAKSELNFASSRLSQEEFLLIFNQIAIAMDEDTDMFNEDYFFISNEQTEENLEINSVSNENILTLEIENFINLSTNLDYNELSNVIEEQVEHGDKDFDVNDLLDN